MSINISFQLMTRAEPPLMVQATIEALLHIKADGDEILIVDNNHDNKALYQPLEAYVASLDERCRVRFFHEDYIAGYKAGALNHALNRIDKACDYIVVVDSDYQAMPWARLSIERAIKQYPSKALLQFPQYYRDTHKPDIHSELNHYFSYHLSKPINQARALSTGTFAVINKQSLIDMGGWSGDSITEDAQMGVLMHLKGAQTQYIRHIIATGMLPCNLADLIAQRRRWIYGNMQVLVRYPALYFRHKLINTLAPDGSSTRHNLTQSQDLDTLSSEQLTSNNSSIDNLNLNKVDTQDTIVGSGNQQPPLGDNTDDVTGIDQHKMANVLYKEVLTLSGLSLALIPTSLSANWQYLRAHLSQLSAWVNLTGPFIMAQAIAVLGLMLVHITGNFLAVSSQLTLSTPLFLTVLKVCYAAYFIFMIRRLWAYLADTRPLTLPPDHSVQAPVQPVAQPVLTVLRKNDIAKNTLMTRLRAWLVHLSFWELGALSWLPVVWGQQKPFVCTPKIDTNTGKPWQLTLAVSPKLLIGLNLLTAILVVPFSKGLAICAMSIVVIKVWAIVVMISNFNNA